MCFFSTFTPFFFPINLAIPKITLILPPVFVFSPNHLKINHLQPQIPLSASHNKSDKHRGNDPPQSKICSGDQLWSVPLPVGLRVPEDSPGSSWVGANVPDKDVWPTLPHTLPCAYLACGDEIFAGKRTISTSINHLLAPTLVSLH